MPIAWPSRAARGACRNRCGSLRAQALAYSGLLDIIVRRAKGDRNRELLLRPLLSIGAAQIEGGTAATVVTPWHPLRLSAMQVKATMAVGLVRHLLTTSEVYFGDTRLYFKDLAHELSQPFYPEVVLGWRGSKPELMVMTDAVQDYTLHESPVINDTEPDDTNENPTAGSNCVLELVQRYLTPHPHEHANMSSRRCLRGRRDRSLPQPGVERAAAVGIVRESGGGDGSGVADDRQVELTLADINA